MLFLLMRRSKIEQCHCDVTQTRGCLNKTDCMLVSRMKYEFSLKAAERLIPSAMRKHSHRLCFHLLAACNPSLVGEKKSYLR